MSGPGSMGSRNEAGRAHAVGTLRTAFDRLSLPRSRRGTSRQPRVAAIALLFAVACASPEASRARGGGSGADIGNRGAVVEFHAGARPYHDTPCVTEPVECTGPEPTFGTDLPGD